MQPLNAVPIEVLAATKKAAERLRSEFLFGIHDGLFTIQDVINASLEAENRPLLKSRLYQLLLAAREISEPTAQRIVKGTLALAAGRETPSARSRSTTYQNMTLKWLLDARSNGRRLACLFEMMVAEGVGDQKRSAPWPGFPMAPAPAEATRGTAMASYANLAPAAVAGGGV